MSLCAIASSAAQGRGYSVLGGPVYGQPVYYQYQPAPPQPVYSYAYSNQPVYYAQQQPVRSYSPSYSMTANGTVPGFDTDKLIRGQDGNTYAKVDGSGSYQLVMGASNGVFRLGNGQALPDDIRAEFTKYYCKDGVLSSYEGQRLTNALAFLSHGDLPGDCHGRASEAIGRVGADQIARNERLKALQEKIAGGGGSDGKDGKGKEKEKEKEKDKEKTPPKKDEKKETETAEVNRLCGLELLTATEADRNKVSALVPTLPKAKLQECLQKWYGALSSIDGAEKALAAQRTKLEADLKAAKETHADIAHLAGIFDDLKVDDRLKPDQLARVNALRARAKDLGEKVKGIERQLTDDQKRQLEALQAERTAKLEQLKPITQKLHDQIPDDADRFAFTQRYGGMGLINGWKEMTDGDTAPSKDRTYEKSPLDKEQQQLVNHIGADFVSAFKIVVDLLPPAQQPAEIARIKKLVLDQAKTAGMKDADLAKLQQSPDWLQKVMERGEEHQKLVAKEEEEAKKKDPLGGIQLTAITAHLAQAKDKVPPKFFEFVDNGGKRFVREIPLKSLTDEPGHRMSEATRKELFAWHANKAVADPAYLAANKTFFQREMSYWKTANPEPLNSFMASLAGQYRALSTDKAKQKDFAGAVTGFFNELPDKGRGIRSRWDAVTGGKAIVDLDYKGKSKRFYEFDGGGTGETFVVGVDDNKIYARKGDKVEDMTDLASSGGSDGSSGSRSGFRSPAKPTGGPSSFIGSDGVEYFFTGRYDGMGRPIYSRERPGGSSGGPVGDTGDTGGRATGRVTGGRLAGLIKFLKNPNVGALLNAAQMSSVISSVRSGLPGTIDPANAAHMDMLYALGTALASRHRDTFENILKGGKGGNFFDNATLKSGRDRKYLEDMIGSLPRGARDKLDEHISQVVMGNGPLEDPCARICDMWERHLNWSEGQPDAFASSAKADYDYAIASLQAAAAVETYHFCPDKVGKALEKILPKLKRFEGSWLKGTAGSSGGDARNPYKSYGLRFSMMLADAIKQNDVFRDSAVAKANPWLGTIDRNAMEQAVGKHVADSSNIGWTGGSAMHFYAMALTATGLSPDARGNIAVKYTGPDGKQKSAGIYEMMKDKQFVTRKRCEEDKVPDPDLCAPYDITVGHTQVVGGVREPRGAAARIVPFAIMMFQQEPNNPERMDYLIRALNHFVNQRSGSLFIHGNSDEVHYGKFAQAPYYYVPGLFQLPEAVVQAMKYAKTPEQRGQLDELFAKTEKLVAASHMPNGNFISPTGQFGNSVQWANPMGILATAPLVNSCNGKPVKPVLAAVPMFTPPTGGRDVASGGHHERNH